MYHKHHSSAAPALALFVISFLFLGGGTPPASAWSAWGLNRTIAVSPDSHWVYVADAFAEGVAIIDATTNQLVKILPVSKVGALGALAVSPYGTHLYGSDGARSQLTTVDLASGKVVARVDVDKGPSALGLSPDGGRAYVLCRAGTVSVVDLRADQVVATIPVGSNPGDLVVQPDGSRVYVSIPGSIAAGAVSSHGGQVVVIDTAENRVIQKVPVNSGSLALAISPDGEQLYVTHSIPGSTSVDVIRTQGLGRSSESVGGFAAAAVVSPDSRRLYVLASEFDLVAAIDLASSQLVGVSHPEREPVGLAESPDGRRLYLEEFNTRTLMVIDAATLQRLASISLLPAGPHH
jgi:YVTN family beta-propeller protein